MSPANCRRPRRIALVDCNNFYVSCERVFHPAWERRPLGVLSNNDGCIVARSDELKAAGIPMGAPYFKYRGQLQAMDAVIVSSNYPLYGDMSARVMSTLSCFTPEMDIYSIDEAWLDLTGFDLGALDAYGREMVATIRQHTGIPVSVGIGPTRVLAKIANCICKKRRILGQVFNLGSAASLEAVLESMAVNDIWGVGQRLSERLRSEGVYTARDLRDCDPQTMRTRYSVVMERIVLELRGIPCLEREDVKPKKQIMVSRSFGARVTALPELCEAVSLHASRAGEKLRREGSCCRALQVFVGSGKHNPRERYFARASVVRFAVATADTRKLIRAAKRGVESIFKDGVRYAKAGVMLCDLVPEEALQGELFHEGDSAKDTRLLRVIDRLNGKRRKSVFFAAQGIALPGACGRRIVRKRTRLGGRIYRR